MQGGCVKKLNNYLFMLDFKQGEPLSKYTTFHIGGAAKYFVIVKNKEELIEALNFAREKSLKYFIFGGGSNFIFADEGYEGLVIKVAFDEIGIEGDEVFAGAGVPLLLLVKNAADAGLAGLENFAGIPGTVGGAVCGNAGAYGKSISDVVSRAEILTVGHSVSYSVEVVDNSWFQYDYRASKLKYWTNPDKPVLLKAWFKLTPGNKEEIQTKVKEILEARKLKEPKGFCAGCAFKNIKGPMVGELLGQDFFSPEEKNIFASRGAIPAAWFIDRAELKGKKIGGAYVPGEHANYIMSDGTATAQDVITMISYIKQQVRDRYGVQLEEEIQIVL